MGFDEILIIIGIAVVVIGPQRLPEYAEQLAKLVKNVRQMATGATATIREELGDEFTDLDFSKFDPRQYDPRRIVREALLEDIVPATKPSRAKTPTKPPVKPVSKGGPGAAAGATAVAAAAVTSTEDAPVAETDAAVDGSASTDDEALVGASAPDLPPFDDEAT